MVRGPNGVGKTELGWVLVFFFQAEDGIRDIGVTGVQTCALPIWAATGIVAAGTATFAYAAGIERRHWTLREATLPVLPPGTRDLKVLHLSDLHMTDRKSVV